MMQLSTTCSEQGEVADDPFSPDLIHKLPGAMRFQLPPDVPVARLQLRRPQGLEMLASRAAV